MSKISTTSTKPHRLNDGMFWTWWLLAGLAGFGIGGPLGVALGHPGYIIENGFMSISFGVILTTILQWLILRQRITRTSMWVPSSIIASVVFGMIVFGGMQVNTDVAWIVGAGTFPLLTGYLQWQFVLRKHSLQGALWWVVTSLAAFLLSGMGGGLLSGLFGFSGKEGGLESIITWTVFGSVFGAATGFVLLRILRHKASNES